MEGDLLDARLSRDWELPRVSTSSALDLQLKEVFGSDEEEEDNFPLSRGVLEDGSEANQLFSSIDESLDVLNPPDQSNCLDGSDERNAVDKNAESMDVTSSVVEGDTCEPQINTKENIEKEKAAPVRQSARLRKKMESGTSWLGEDALLRKPAGKGRQKNVKDSHSTADRAEEEKENESQRKKEELEKKYDLEEKSNSEGEVDTMETNSPYLATNAPQTAKGQASQRNIDHEVKKKNKDTEQQETQKSGTSIKEVTEEQEEEEEEMEDDDSDDGGSSDDPDRLWCICQQPHNDRFMICCDQCEEWYHGECVGISLAEGKKMEKLGVDYICTKCEEQQKEAKSIRCRDRSLRQAHRAQLKEKRMNEFKKRMSDSSSSVSLHSSSPSDDQHQLFAPDQTSHSAQSKTTTQVKEEGVPCIGPGCAANASKPSLYCGDNCIERHVERSLKKLSEKGVAIQTTLTEYVKGAGGITVYEPATKKILTGIAAPGRKVLVPWIKAHPSYKVFLPSGKGSQLKQSKKKVKEEAEPGSSNPTKNRSSALLDMSTIRSHAKRAFCQALLTRCKAADDLALTEMEVTAIAEDLEVKLYNVHNQEVNSKYRNRLRSLLFNLKDTKNKGLFRRVLLGEITTKELVRMTPDQMASEELTQWRVSTMRKELEMIKEVAEEEMQLSSSKTIRKMTYKGEVEIEQPTAVQIEGAEKLIEVGDSSTSSLPSPLKPALVLPIKTTPNIILNPLTNTTSQHLSHIFDQNCDICLGKIPPPDKVTQTTKSSTVVTSTSANSSLSSSEDEPQDNTNTEPSWSHDVRSVSPTPQQPLWKGYIAMHGMETFLTSAYSVSGQTDMLEKVLPETLQVVGRIAHVQVWDYLDKIKSSSSKVIAVIRFECLHRVESEQAAYINMLDYFMEKHRYGVFQTGFGGGVKDMYLIPLSYDDPVPLPIQPFSGPGLPSNRRNMFLGVITRNTKESTHTSSSSSTALKGRRFHGSVHFSGPKHKKQKIVDFAGTSPSVGNNEENSPDLQLTSPVISDDPTASTKVSFYGEHIDMETDKKLESDTEKGESSVGISHPGIKSILSQLSDDKLQELASAMSSISGVAEETKGAPDKASSIGEGATKKEEGSLTQPRSMSLDERISATLGKITSPSSSPQTTSSYQKEQTSSKPHDRAQDKGTDSSFLPKSYPISNQSHLVPNQPPASYSTVPQQQYLPSHPPQPHSHPPSHLHSQPLPHSSSQPPVQSPYPPTLQDQPHNPTYPYPQSGAHSVYPYSQDNNYYQQKGDRYYQHHSYQGNYPQHQHDNQYDSGSYGQEMRWRHDDSKSGWGRGQRGGPERGNYDGGSRNWDHRVPPSHDWGRGQEGGGGRGGQEAQQYYRWNPEYPRRGMWSKR